MAAQRVTRPAAAVGMTDGADRRLVARSKQGGRAERMAVVSGFERVEGRWLYVDDDAAA